MYACATVPRPTVTRKERSPTNAAGVSLFDLFKELAGLLERCGFGVSLFDLSNYY